MRVKLHPEARAELRKARRWYYERSPLSATAFAHAVDSAVSKIAGAPTQYPLAEHGTRKCALAAISFQHILSNRRLRNGNRCCRPPETAAGLLVESLSGLTLRAVPTFEPHWLLVYCAASILVS